jgi:ADP-glucose pyrophosphorylase
LTNPISQFNLFDRWNPIYSRRRHLAPAKFFGTHINQTILAEGCIINAKRIEHAVVGIRSRVGDNTTILHSILMGHDYYETLEQFKDNTDKIPLGIGKNCHIERAIIDKNARIGNDVIIRGAEGLPNREEANYSIVEGIVVVKKKAQYRFSLVHKKEAVSNFGDGFFYFKYIDLQADYLPNMRKEYVKRAITYLPKEMVRSSEIKVLLSERV